MSAEDNDTNLPVYAWGCRRRGTGTHWIKNSASLAMEETANANKRNYPKSECIDGNAQGKQTQNSRDLVERQEYILKNKDKIPRLLLAAAVGDVAVVEALLEGENVGVTDESGADVFDYAAANRAHGASLVDLFHARGAKMRGAAPVERALEAKNFDVCVKLFRLLKEETNLVGNLLNYCVRSNKLEFAKFVFAADASLARGRPSAHGHEFSEQLLFEAVQFADRPMCEWLFGQAFAHVDLNKRQTEWKGEVLYAVADNAEHGAEVAKFLFGRFVIGGAEQETNAWYSHTPFAHAWILRNEAVARELFRHCANLSLSTKPDVRRQIRAARGIDPEVGVYTGPKTDCECKNALQIALDVQNLKAAEQLLGSDASLAAKCNYLHYCVRKNKLSSAKWVHAKCSNLMRQAGDGGVSVLHLAARFADLQMCRWLVSQGADPAARTSEGRSVADFAATEDLKEYFRALTDCETAK